MLLRRQKPLTTEHCPSSSPECVIVHQPSSFRENETRSPVALIPAPCRKGELASGKGLREQNLVSQQQRSTRNLSSPRPMHSRTGPIHLITCRLSTVRHGSWSQRNITQPRARSSCSTAEIAELSTSAWFSRTSTTYVIRQTACSISAPRLQPNSTLRIQTLWKGHAVLGNSTRLRPPRKCSS